MLTSNYFLTNTVKSEIIIVLCIFDFPKIKNKKIKTAVT